MSSEKNNDSDNQEQQSDNESENDELKILIEDACPDDESDDDDSVADEPVDVSETNEQINFDVPIRYDGECRWNMDSLEEIVNDIGEKINEYNPKGSNWLHEEKEINDLYQEAAKTIKTLLVMQSHAFSELIQENEQLKKKGKIRKVKRHTLHRGQYTKSGNTFFIVNTACPNNEDYLRRKAEREMFPMDFELQPNHVWTNLDKKLIMQGVKEQCVNHLMDMRRMSGLVCNMRLHNLLLKDLLSQVDDQFQICWTTISVHTLNGRHSVISCRSMWEQYVRPGLNHGEWSSSEIARLKQAARKYAEQNWAAIAEMVGQRSEFQCFVHYVNNSSLRKKWTRFTKADDKCIVSLVQKYSDVGRIRWDAIDAYIANKQKGSCRSRYYNSLCASIRKEPFVAAEDLQLMEAIAKYGDKFTNIPKHALPKNRSLTQLRARYKECLKTRAHMKPWSALDDEKLVDLVAKYGKSSWSKVADALSGHTRSSCRTRYFTICKFLNEHPQTQLCDVPRKASVRHLNSRVTAENWQQISKEMKKNPEVLLRPKNKREIAKDRTRLKRQQKIDQKQAKVCERLKTIENKLLDDSNSNDPISKDNEFMRYSWYALDYKFFSNKTSTDTRDINYEQLALKVREYMRYMRINVDQLALRTIPYVMQQEKYQPYLLNKALLKTAKDSYRMFAAQNFDICTHFGLRAMYLQTQKAQAQNIKPFFTPSNNEKITQLRTILRNALQEGMRGACKLYKAEFEKATRAELLAQYQVKRKKRQELTAILAYSNSNRLDNEEMASYMPNYKILNQHEEATEFTTVTIVNAGVDSTYEIRIMPDNSQMDDDNDNDDYSTIDIECMKCEPEDTDA